MSGAPLPLFESVTTLPTRLHRFEHRAMACLWELYLAHDDAAYAEHAARACFDEITRLESELSRFVETSDISQLNSAPAGRPVRLSLDAFECLTRAAELHGLTHGAFDVTVGSLLRTVSPSSGSSAMPHASAPIGMHLIALHPQTRQAAKLADGVTIDLGAIGKGHAVDRVAAVLREWDIRSALIHSGQSSLYALGPPPGGHEWTIAVRNPAEHGKILGTVAMRSLSLSGSGVLLHGRHIFDPRTGQPSARPAIGAWAIGPSAAATDAVSTAFMVLEENEVAELCRTHAPVGGMLCIAENGAHRVACFNFPLHASE